MSRLRNALCHAYLMGYEDAMARISPCAHKTGVLLDTLEHATMIRVKLIHGGIMPVRAHDTDAGADIMTPEGFVLKAHGSEIVATGVCVQLPPNTVGMLKSKSGLNTRHGIVSEGVIDEGYSGEIVVKLYNHSDEDYRFEAGNKITQLVVLPVCYHGFAQADEIRGGERGTDGFGSTGK